ncbi:MAG: tetratricopeptide repeat protein [Bacteroidales bacterium]|nr:tetratricopeptide repeat protein [Bacteroidales bacterium]
MKSINLLLAKCSLIGVALLFVACGPNRDKEVKQISQMEETLREVEMVADSTTCNKMIGLYLDFVNHFPEDSLSPIYLYHASDLALNIGRYDKSLQCLHKIIENYPDFSEASTCYFLIGNAYEESEKYDSAVIAYNEFLELYPDHPLAESARFAVSNIGQPLEQVLQDLLAANTKDSNK